MARGLAYLKILVDMAITGGYLAAPIEELSPALSQEGFVTPISKVYKGGVNEPLFSVERR